MTSLLHVTTTENDGLVSCFWLVRVKLNSLIAQFQAEWKQNKNLSIVHYRGKLISKLFKEGGIDLKQNY